MAKESGIGGALSSPTGWILAGGVVYLAYRIYKDAIDAAEKAAELALKAAKDVGEGFNPQPSYSPADQPAGPATSRLSARILEPGNNGVAPRGFFDRKFKVSVQLGNPGDYTVVEVTVRVEAISRLTGVSEVLQVARQIQVSGKATTVHDFWFQFVTPITHDGVAEVLVNGKSLAPPVVFTID